VLGKQAGLGSPEPYPSDLIAELKQAVCLLPVSSLDFDQVWSCSG